MRKCGLILTYIRDAHPDKSVDNGCLEGKMTVDDWAWGSSRRVKWEMWD